MSEYKHFDTGTKYLKGSADSDKNMLTVGQLLEQLKDQDPNTPVVVKGSGQWWQYVEEVKKWDNSLGPIVTLDLNFTTGNPMYWGHKVTIGTFRKKFVIVAESGDLWANEYMKTLDEAKDFCRSNGFTITSDEVKPFVKQKD